MGLPFMAAQLRRDGHAAEIFDRFAVQSRAGQGVSAADKSMLARIAGFRPDWVGLSTITPLIHDTVHCAGLIRKEGFRGEIWAGGYHATALPELTLRKIPELDGVVAGEGEEVLSKLADGTDPAALPGVWRRDGSGVRPGNAPKAQVADLDGLALPAFDLMDMGFYTERTAYTVRGHNLRAVTLITSRGCEFRCRFCAESLTYGRGIRFHSAEYILEWVRKLAAEYPVDGIHFHDNDFLADEGRVRKICAGLRRLGLHRRLRWSIQARSDRLSPELARLLKQSGCVLVEIGIETGSQEELDRLGKGATVDQGERAVRLCRRAGLDVHAYMLRRTENETLAVLDQRLAWLRRADPTSFQWNDLQIYPGTPLYAERGGDFFARNPWTEEAVTGYYSADHVSGLPPEIRNAWTQKHFAPFVRRHFWRHAIGRVPLDSLVRRIWLGGTRRMKRLVAGESRVPARTPDAE
ncbi:MAG: B12-binding domain-containing radical SAM protein [Anaerolineales bacterium]|nr:B12-binding domain-containing radical SAM protein [Anaerolineales bacterium]